MTQAIKVPFVGDGKGVGQLTWAQRNIWRMMQMLGTPEMVGGVMPLDEGTSVENIVHLLSFIMSRHQSLRTRIRVEPDGTPVQMLSDSGEATLEVHDVAEGDDPAQVAEAIRERFETSPFDIENEWPVRMAVIRQDGVPVYFAAMYPHMVIDGYGFDALVSDLENLDLNTGERLAPRQGIQPLELATLQQTPAERRKSEHAMRYWEQLLRTIPAQRFHESADKREPRWWDGIYDSPAGFKALRVLGDRTGLHTGPILMAAYAVAMAMVTGISPSVQRTMVSNRFRSGFTESVSVLVQPGICAIDVAGYTFDEIAQQTFRSQLAAGKHGYYDPRDLWALIDRVNRERGVELDLMCYFNDRRLALAQMPVGPLPTVAEITEALPGSTWRWGVRTNNPDAKAYLNVNMKPDTLNYELRVDTHALSPLDMLAVMRHIEGTLVSAVLDPDAVIRVSQTEHVSLVPAG
jgi:Condensation domain